MMILLILITLLGIWGPLKIAGVIFRGCFWLLALLIMMMLTVVMLLKSCHCD